MKKLFMLLALLVVVSATALAVSGDFHARRDLRLCPSPWCGGWWLIADGTPDACGAAQPDAYVTGIYAPRGPALVPIYPPCEDVITGSTYPDPYFPDFEIFIIDSLIVGAEPTDEPANDKEPSLIR